MQILRRFGFGVHVIKHHFKLVIWALLPIFVCGLTVAAAIAWFGSQTVFYHLETFSQMTRSCVMLSWSQWITFLVVGFLFCTVFYWYLASFNFLCQQAMNNQAVSIRTAVKDATNRLPVIASVVLAIIAVIGVIGVVIYLLPMSDEATIISYTVIGYLFQLAKLLFIFLPIVLALSFETKPVAVLKETLDQFFKNWGSVILGLLLLLAIFIVGMLVVVGVIITLLKLYGITTVTNAPDATLDQQFTIMQTAITSHPTLVLLASLVSFMFGVVILYAGIAFNIYMISLYRNVPIEKLHKNYK